MKAPPLDPAHPTPAHQWLPIPSVSAKLRSNSTTSSSGTPTSPTPSSTITSSAAHTIPGPQVFGRFPPGSQNLSEQDLDPYFANFESSTRELELLLQGNIERVNRRTLNHLSSLSTDMAELGARYNAFSLSEQSPSVAAAIERIGQAVDSSYIATEELSSTLGASFAEPMRESAQFAGVVRSVLRFRILKRVQEEMTKDELAKKRTLLETLERSESESKRIEQYLSSTGAPSAPSRSTSSASARNVSDSSIRGRKDPNHEETASIDSDFPPTHADIPSSPPSGAQDDPTSPGMRKSQTGGFVTNKIFGRISHAVHGIVDVDPERTRRDQIGKTKESLVQVNVNFNTRSGSNHTDTCTQLEQALDVSEKDVKDASSGVLKDLKRFQAEKEDDLKRYMVHRPRLSRLARALRLPGCRLPMPNAILTGRRRTLRHGEKRAKRWRRLMFGSETNKDYDAGFTVELCTKANRTCLQRHDLRGSSAWRKLDIVGRLPDLEASRFSRTACDVYSHCMDMNQRL